MPDVNLDLRGIYPPIPTPFDAHEAIDFEALKHNLTFLEPYPLRGIVVLGSNGEAVHLTMDERIALVRMVRAFLPSDRLLIAGTGCPSTRQTIELSLLAAEAGADAVLVLPPHYYRSRMTSDALVQHFHAVADACRVPVIVYNMPACTGIDLSAETIASIAEHPSVIGLKDSSGDVVKLGTLEERLGDRLQLLAGSAGFLLPALSVGAVGGVLALANIAPGQCLAIQHHAQSGAWDEARTMQTRMVEPNTAVTRRWGVAGLKAAMDRLGLHGGRVRAPLLPLDADEREQLEAILREAGLVKRNPERSP